MSSSCGGCFCKGDTLMSVTVVVVSFGFLSMFGVLIPTAVRAIYILSLTRAHEALDPFFGALVTAMFIACAAYVAAGVCAILDLRFIAINKRRNFIITTIGYVAAVFFLVTGGITLMFNIAYGFTTPQGMPLDVLDSLISSIQFVSCVILMGCYVIYLLLQPYIEEKQRTNTSVISYELHHNQSEMQ